ncbi:type VI secretion system baseplate subunit TssE [Zavarzinia compransoris]|uniref:type VI secretion system baseplate subunit TssE n=1 Tax=Zavarzinia compransoris TaxID=1264899 RepID=UPI0010DE1999|nr:type VI secretion system baseplate subunit TssE [Zavarzinia compransoris]TDP46907.1 type VI secretion system protein ImpF [Zavarzinia compransoris]
MSVNIYGDQPLSTSLLDRLVDAGGGDGQPRSRGASLRDLKQAIRRDLETLLNARQRCRSWSSDLTELDTSLVNFGIPDFTAGSFESHHRLESLRRAIEISIRRFEPRFESVYVEITDQEAVDRSFHIRISAMMHAEPEPEQIVLDSLLESSTRTFEVVENAHD